MGLRHDGAAGGDAAGSLALFSWAAHTDERELPLKALPQTAARAFSVAPAPRAQLPPSRSGARRAIKQKMHHVLLSLIHI